MKIIPVRTELFHVEGWTDRQADTVKLIVVFPSFVNVPKKMTACI